MNGMLVVVLTLIVLSAVYGYRKGILGMLLTVLTWILIFAGVPYATPHIEHYMREEESISTFIDGRIENYVDKRIEAAKETLKDPEGDITIPEGAFGVLGDVAAEKIDELIEREEQRTRTILIEETADIVYHLISYIAAIIGVMLVIWLLNLIAKAINYVPVIGTASRILGLLLGLFNGFVIVWVIFYALLCLKDTETGSALTAMINDQPILLMLFEENPIRKLLDMPKGF